MIWHHGKAFVAAVRYGFPARKLTVIGVTGTDGKTTTVSMVAHILHENEYSVGALSTAFFRVTDEIHWNATQKTSPSPFVIQKFLRRLVSEGCTHAVLEISSHGLVQGRTNWIFPSVTAITNTSPEHLDYHGTMERYRRDKRKLFEMVRGKGVKVLNRDDETYGDYCRCNGNEISFGTGGDLSVSNIELSSTSSSCTVRYQTSDVRLQMPVIGSFNLENAQCAIGCGLAIGISLEQCCNALGSFPGTPGRMENVQAGQDFDVLVDFTVTPAAYEKTLSTLRAVLKPDRRLLVLTGSCGDRMREKRPQVGEICSRLGDIVVVTNEDPYTEDPQKIIDEVWAGIDQSACEAKQIFDRKDAMQWLFSRAEEGDIVILCAKGSDTTMWTAEGQIPWDDRETAKALLQPQ